MTVTCNLTEHCFTLQDGWVGFRGIVCRKRMTAKSFYNGFLSKCDQKLTEFMSLPNDLEKCLSPLPMSRQRLEADATIHRRRAVNLGGLHWRDLSEAY